MSKTGK